MIEKKNPIFPIIIVITVLWQTFNMLFAGFDTFSIISSLIGICGIILYYKDHTLYDKFIYAWIFMQFPDITFSGNNIINSFPIQIGVGLSFTLKSNDVLSIYLNFLPIPLYFLFKYINFEKPLNKNFVIGRLRKGSFPNVHFPIKGKVEKIHAKTKFTPIYLFSLDTEINILNKSHKIVLLEPKNDTIINTNNKSQICGLRICEDVNAIYNESNNKFIDWVTVVIE